MYATFTSSFLMAWLVLSHVSADVVAGQFKTTINKWGDGKTSIVTLDNVLPPKVYASIHDSLRSRVDFIPGTNHNISFPGIIAPLDFAIVDPIINAILSSPPVTKMYPKEIFNEKESITGFASVLCASGWVHTDPVGMQHQDVAAPAVVFYVGNDARLKNDNKSPHRPTTGTTFYRDIKVGLKQRTDGIGNVTASRADAAGFEEVHRVLAIANRLVIYRNDILRQDWMEDESHGKEIGDGKFSLPCSSQEGLLAISLFFRSRRRGEGLKIMNVIDDEWRMKAMNILKGVVFNDGGGGGDSLEQTEVTRRELNARRQLVDDCVAFVKGNAFNMVNVASCNLISTTTIEDGETLRIRGRDDLEHPELMRGGSAISPWVFRHFVMDGVSFLTLMNLKLSGAWVGSATGPNGCGYCQYVSELVA